MPQLRIVTLDSESSENGASIYHSEPQIIRNETFRKCIGGSSYKVLIKFRERERERDFRSPKRP